LVKSLDKSPIFQIGTANISCDEVVKLLGVDIDIVLNFMLWHCHHPSDSLDGMVSM